MKKVILSICAIIIIHLNLDAQFLSAIQTPKKNVAYFETINVFENLKLVNTISEKIFFYEYNNSLYINDTEFPILYKTNCPTKDTGVVTVVYKLVDKNKEDYEMTIYYLDGMATIGCMIEKNTNMRFGFKLGITKNW